MRWLVRLGIGLATVAVVIALTLAPRPDPSEATGVVDGPVVALPYPNGIRPMADVWGELTLRGDCLMLGDGVVFWPAGTSWDAESQSVVFSGDFDGSVSVGSHFEGAGGVYSLTDDFLRGLGDSGDVLRDCVAATGARDVRLAYP
ncbi:hypothetical protein GCM10009844_39020 [Nocardioides koreensis]|uniref:Uncharacterized protein n=1 Tax=Nocardioides koreensis TaxID=433651 RepID=A0ABP5LTZ1_9ACTN